MYRGLTRLGGSQKTHHSGLPRPLRASWASQVAQLVKNPPANAGDTRDPGSTPGLEKIPWSRKWWPTPASLPGESHGQRSLATGSMGLQGVRHDWAAERTVGFSIESSTLGPTRKVGHPQKALSRSVPLRECFSYTVFYDCISHSLNKHLRSPCWSQEHYTRPGTQRWTFCIFASRGLQSSGEERMHSNEHEN